MKRYSAERYLEILKEIVFQNYRTCTSKNNGYTDFIYRFVGAINFTALAKRIRVKANSEHWFDGQIMSTIPRRDKLYKKLNISGIKTDKDNF